MNTREQLAAEYQEKLRQLETEETLRAVLPVIEGLDAPRLHQYALYGSRGSVTYGDSYHNEKRATLAQLAVLLRALPPAPVVKAKGTFTRFITEAFADSDANKEKGKETLELIFPVTLKTSSCTQFSLKAGWCAEIAGDVWRVDTYLINPYTLARVDARRVDFRGGFRYEDSSLHINAALNPPDGYWQRVKWGRGSDEYPHDFTAYHGQFDDDAPAWAERAASLLASGEFERAI